MTVYVDLQFFNLEDQFVVKEFAALTSNMKLTHYVFKPPVNFACLTQKDKRQVKWVERNYHKISWNGGYVPYKYAGEIIKKGLRNFENVFVKGVQKVNYLQSLGIVAQNIECSYEVGGLRTLDFRHGISCMNHKDKNYICALLNVCNIKKIVESNFLQ